MMKCVICKKGETKAGTATVTLDKDGATLGFQLESAQIAAKNTLMKHYSQPSPIRG
jgi:hypothetical protein